MDELFSLHANGLFLRREALEHGFRDRHLVEALRGGVLHRVRHGTYVDSSVWHEADSIKRFRLRGQGVQLTHPGAVALSHTSGAAEHGLRLWNPDLTKVHVTRLDRNHAGGSPDVVYHEGHWHPDDVYAQEEGLVLGPETCGLGAASLTSVPQGLAILDSVIDLGLGSQESLWSAYQQRERWPRSRRLQLTVRLARPGAQSVGESASRAVMWGQHLPEPVLQFEVYDEHGKLVGVTDFAWPDLRLLGEFDGKAKYGRLLRDGERPEDAVFREKKREDALREATNFLMIRYVWSDIYRPRQFAERTRRKMRQAVRAA